MIKSEIPSTTTKPGNSHQCPHPGCLKTFNRRSHLVSHIVTHTDQKNFSCELCNAVFARCHDLQRHQRTKHIAGGGKAFACGSCGLGFARKDSMKKHLDKHCKVLHGAAGSA
ncbi:hypothetical protein BC829DRAFT_361678 [Chytridium lagenaria]|nr:hypothetical protein BC829DRAFT_361678 [Chytridium lagenaria]